MKDENTISCAYAESGEQATGERPTRIASSQSNCRSVPPAIITLNLGFITANCALLLAKTVDWYFRNNLSLKKN
jgi:hypothetical protein